MVEIILSNQTSEVLCPFVSSVHMSGCYLYVHTCIHIWPSYGPVKFKHIPRPVLNVTQFGPVSGCYKLCFCLHVRTYTFGPAMGLLNTSHPVLNVAHFGPVSASACMYVQTHLAQL